MHRWFVSVIAVTLLCAGAGFGAGGDDWGHPLGRSYSGPEVHPRPVTPGSTLAGDELATMTVFEQASRSVVFIANSAIRRDFWSLNLSEVPSGSGSGFVWNKQGHIVTNFHVIYGADAITVTLADRTQYRARVVGADPDHDLAVLQIRAPDDALVPITIGSSRDLKVGQKVLAIGNPFGLDHTLTTGVVSAVGRTIKSMTNRTIDNVIQTDAAINPGNSGGPLLESSGRLIGINTQIMSPSGAYAGIGFAVPVDTINRLVPELIRNGKVIRPSLGLTVLPDAMAARLGLNGVAVARVIAGGPAAAAGLRGLREGQSGAVALGDVITKVAGAPVHTADDLFTVLDHHAMGDKVTVEFQRDGRRQQVTVTLAAIDSAARR